jgi:uncharacterized protein
VADRTPASRVTSLDWKAIVNAVDRDGFAHVEKSLLTAPECTALIRAFDDDAQYRSTIDMARHRFGEGCYRYYRYPLPPVVAELRDALYPRLAEVANDWAKRLGEPTFPATHAELLEECAARGQTKPTPLILRYREGGWNALHQDVYGDLVFPLQVSIALSRPGVDFDGGEMLFVEQRPRSQSRGHVVTPERGHAVVFTTRSRPVMGTLGAYRAAMRHGVSTLRRGSRLTLGIIFHDAR